MKFPKRMLACLVSFCLILAMVPATAFAADDDETTAAASTEAAVETEAEEEEPETTEGEEEEPETTESETTPAETTPAETTPAETTPAETTPAETTEPEATPEETASDLPQSNHDYDNGMDESWEYTVTGATNGIVVTFDSQTETENNWDFIYIYDGNDNQVGRYTGTALAGASVYVPTATVRIRLTSDSSGTKWGFAVTSIENVGDSIDLGRFAAVDAISPVEVGGDPAIIVRINGVALTKDTDYTVTYDTSAAGEATATVTGTGKYSGTLEPEFFVYDEDHLADGAVVDEDARILLRSAADFGGSASSYISFSDATEAWTSVIEEITLTPINSDGSETDTGDLVYPHAPKEITLDKDQLTVRGSSVYFDRTAEEPIVYVMEGHEPIDIKGMRSTVTYPQSQIYKVTVKATGYKPTEGTITYYTGTAPAFSIIVDEDGDPDTKNDQTIVDSWTTDEIKAMSEFANGSSQCGMTGFRTFSGMGVSLKDLLAEAEVEVSDSDYFELFTSDQYGNEFTYDALFNTTRYFLAGIYNPEFVDVYNELVASDDEAGATVALRRYLAEQAQAMKSVVEPRINVNYAETLIAGSSLADAVLPTEENTKFNELTVYENQFRFFYGIALVRNECTVTFDSQGGSEVEAQTVLSHLLTSTENTTIKSSYWASSLIIYRGAGEPYKTEPSDTAASIAVPEDPTREGYTFAGWYTDAECTNRFSFTLDDGTVDQDTTLYAKWIPNESAINITDFDITNAPHKDEDGELNQTIIATITFDADIKLTSDDLSDDLLITIAGGDVKDTPRNATYEVKNGNQLVITLVSTDWAAVYNGIMVISEGKGGITHIVAADGSDREIAWTDQEGRIPIGIEVINDVIKGTATTPASTKVTVAHKANMRGMYFFELVSIVDGEENVLGSFVSHAHDFTGSIDEAAIAKAMAAAINGAFANARAVVAPYSASYNEGDPFFVVNAADPVEGEVLVVRMNEINGEAVIAHTPAEPVIEEGVLATETTPGYYYEVIYCSFCGEELSRESIDVPAKGKNPEPTNSSQTGNTTGTTTTGAKPNTGDNAPIALYIVLFAAAMGVCVVVYRRKKVSSQ